MLRRFSLDFGSIWVEQKEKRVLWIRTCQKTPCGYISTAECSYAAFLNFFSLLDFLPALMTQRKRSAGRQNDIVWGGAHASEHPCKPPDPKQMPLLGHKGKGRVTSAQRQMRKESSGTMEECSVPAPEVPAVQSDVLWFIPTGNVG